MASERLAWRIVHQIESFKYGPVSALPSIWGWFRRSGEEAQELVERTLLRRQARPHRLKLEKSLDENLFFCRGEIVEPSRLDQLINVNLLRAFHEQPQLCRIFNIVPELGAANDRPKTSNNLIDRLHETSLPHMPTTMLGVFFRPLIRDKLAWRGVFWCRGIPFCEQNVPKLLVPIDWSVATVHGVLAGHFHLITTHPSIRV
mmetsp:Transcript_2926/g.6822  ORF Transcript_2926/g.6822 Transcript_2926/m.6822 type:complete len:202 (-) Transcript_2926:1138-1743(-)